VPIPVIKETVPVEDIPENIIIQGEVCASITVEAIQTAGQIIILNRIVVTFCI
jgi:hypothetical protein